MTAKSDALEKLFIDQIFAGLQMSTYATLYVSLHTASPTDAGDQTSSETTYGGYQRQAVSVPAGWTASASQAVNAADLLFPTATSGSDLITHFAIGTQASGTGTLLYHAALVGSVQIAVDVQPKFVAGAITVTED